MRDLWGHDEVSVSRVCQPVPGSTDFRLILRPVVTLGIVGATAEGKWDALVDTGADETLLPMSLARVLGVNLDPSLTSRATDVSGNILAISYGEVVLRIESGSEVISWRTAVGFVEFDSASEEMVILGHGGCLDYFTATFDGQNAELELTPNADFP